MSGKCRRSVANLGRVPLGPNSAVWMWLCTPRRVYKADVGPITLINTFEVDPEDLEPFPGVIVNC